MRRIASNNVGVEHLPVEFARINRGSDADHAKVRRAQLSCSVTFGEDSARLKERLTPGSKAAAAAAAAAAK